VFYRQNTTPIITFFALTRLLLNSLSVIHHHVLEIPLRWKKPRTIFVNSMSNLFHKNISFDFISKVSREDGSPILAIESVLGQQKHKTARPL